MSSYTKVTSKILCRNSVRLYVECRFAMFAPRVNTGVALGLFPIDPPLATGILTANIFLNTAASMSESCRYNMVYITE